MAKSMRAWLIIGTFVIALLIIADLGPLPYFLLNSGGISIKGLQPFQKLELEQSLRTTVLQAVGGLLLISGAVATWRQVVTAGQTLSLNRSIKATDILARAIDQLGSEALAIRIGGIYTLDRIARDEPAERARVVVLLATFVQRIPENPLDDISPDIQAALTVLIARRATEVIRLNGARLRGASLTDANLCSASLRHVTLNHAALAGANLQGACLENADMQGADLSRADLSHADLRGADLRNAILTGTKLDFIQSDGETRWSNANN